MDSQVTDYCVQHGGVSWSMEIRCYGMRANILFSIADNLDPPLEKWLRKNFPKEVKEREREIEADDRFDTWGIETVTPEPSRGRDGGCVIM